MPLATQCDLNGESISVDLALILRDQARSRRTARPDFRCMNCGAEVRPHRDGGHVSAHFEHLERNPQCPLSDPRDETAAY